MKKAVYFLCFSIFVFLVSSKRSEAGKVENSYGEPYQVESTAYYEGEVTASGQPVREGIIAGKKEWIGKTCIIYADEDGNIGNYIGIYEVLDTGSDYRIKNGTCVDFYLPDEEDCWEWGRRKVWIQLVDAEG